MSINFEPKREEMKSTRSKNSKFEELVPDEKMRERIMSHLKTKGPLFGEGSVFSELLQSSINSTKWANGNTPTIFFLKSKYLNIATKKNIISKGEFIISPLRGYSTIIISIGYNHFIPSGLKSLPCIFHYD